MKNLLLIAVAALAALAPISAVQAQARSCIFTVMPGVGTVQYDPFQQLTTSIVPVTIQFTRINDAGGAKAAMVDLVLTSDDPELVGLEVIPTGVVGAGTAEGLNQNIFYDPSNTAPAIPSASMVVNNSPPPPDVLRWTYTGNNPASDTFTVTANVVIPPGTEFSTSTSFMFDVEGGCNGTGGGPQFFGPVDVPNGLTLNIEVLSALRATYVGPALDFGEVGDLADTDALPTRNGNIRVHSSDIYQVSMVTQNDYRLTYPGGMVANDQQSLEYSVSYLGESGSEAAAWPTQQCVRAGVATGVQSPISVTLLEGGDDEVPSPNYIDYLIITYTPQINLPAGMSCGTP